MVKNPPANVEDTGVGGSIPRLGRCLEEENGYPLQYSCLESPVDRGAWWATVHGVTKSQTWLKQLSTYAQQSLSDPRWSVSFSKIPHLDIVDRL